MAQTMSSKEAAQKWKCTQTEVTQWCREGKIPGAFKGGSKQTSAWQIPVDAVKPETEKQKKPDNKLAVESQPSKRSGLPIAAGVLLLVADLVPLVQKFLLYRRWDWYVGPLDLVQLLPSMAIVVLLFMGRSGNILTIALGIKFLFSFVADPFNAIFPMPLIFSIEVDPISAISQVPLILMIVLRLPYLCREFSRVWAIPFALGAAVVFVGSFSPDLTPIFSTLSHCIDVWGYLLMGAWLAHPAMTFKSLFFRNIDELEQVGSVIGAIFLRGVAIYGSIITVILFVCILAADKGALPLSIVVPLLLVDVPCIGGVANVCMKFQEGRKATKEVRRSINQVNARSGIRGVAERAQAELNKEAGKKAQKEVIKSAIVGGVIAGDAGAVVGAMSAKAKQDAQKGGASPESGKAAQKDVIKSAVVGGVIAGDAGAVVGAAAAKAKQDAEKKS